MSGIAGALTMLLLFGQPAHADDPGPRVKMGRDSVSVSIREYGSGRPQLTRVVGNRASARQGRTPAKAMTQSAPVSTGCLGIIVSSALMAGDLGGKRPGPLVCVTQPGSPAAPRAAGGGPAAVPVLTPGMVSAAFRRVPVAGFASVSQPDVKTLVNFETIFHTGARPFSRTVALLGIPIRLRIVPSSFRWDFGDGHWLVTAVPGDAYPAKTIVHKYEKAYVTVQHRVTVTWTATYQIAGSPALPVAGSVTTTGPTTSLRIAEAVPTLSGAGH